MAPHQPDVHVEKRENDFELSIRDGEKRLANLFVVPFEQRIGGALVSMGGIAGVNTAPEYREQGYARRLLSFAVEWMRDQGYDWSGLFGIPNFYTRFGYVSALPEYELEIPTRRAELAEETHEIRPLRQDDRDREAVLDVYEAVNRYRTGTVRRDPKRWKGFLKGPGWGTIPAVVVAVNKEGVCGYAVYHRYADGVTVAEIGAFEQAGYESLLRHFARLGVERRAETLRFLVPSSHPLTAICRRLGCRWGIRYPADREGMWRVLNLHPLTEKLREEFEARLERAGYRPSSTRPEGFALDMDECGSVSVRLEGGSIGISAGIRGNLPKLPLSQQTWTQLLMGFREVDEVLYSEGLTDHPAADFLRALFPGDEAVLWWPDRF